MMDWIKKLTLIYTIIFVKFSHCEELIVGLSDQNNNGSNLPVELTLNWKEGDSNLRALTINLSLSIASAGSSTVTLKPPASIKIICSQISNNTEIFAEFEFTELIEPNLDTSKEIQIDFQIKKKGQTPLVKCIGQTVSFSQQTFNSIQLTGLRFANSIDYRIKVVSFPGISFVNTLESATNLQISPLTSSYFDIFFRDLTLYETEIECLLVPQTDNFNLVTNKTTVAAGINQFQIEYKVNFIANISSESFNLTCSANSVNMQQYEPSFATAQAIIQFKQPAIQVSSDLIKFTGKKFSLPLQLNPYQPNRASTLRCNLKRFLSYLDLEDCVATAAITGVSEPDLSSFTYEKKNFDFCFIDPTNSTQCLKTIDIILKNSNYFSINIESSIPVSLNSNLKLYLCMFCEDISSLSIKYENYAGRILLDLAKNSDPNAEYPVAPSNDLLLNPAYAPCECDLTPNSCDLDCCCDGSCSVEDKAAAKLTCPIQVRPVFEKTVDKYYCQDIYNNPREIEEDWFPIVCINFNTTVLLGKFYSPVELDNYVNNQNEKFVNDVENKIKMSYNYRSRYLNDPEVSNQAAMTESILCSLNQQSYEYGTCLLQAETMTDTEAKEFFRFPQATNSFESCVYDAPLRFLFDSNRTFCPLNIDDLSCSSQNKKINSNFFIDKVIIANSNKDKIPVNKIEYYICSTNFASQLPESIPDVNGSCFPNFDPKTKIFDTEFSCENEWTEPKTSNLDKISADFYQTPLNNNECHLISNPNLIIQLNGDTCENVLFGVKHLLFWQGNSIVKILTRVLLTNVKTNEANFKQFFETKWIYLPNQDSFNLNDIDTVSEYDNLISTVDYMKTMRSGQRGYVNGKAIISGFLNDSQIDVSLDKRFSAFRSLNGKLCGQYNIQERQLVSFGKNVSSSCVVRVVKEDLIDETKCESIRKIMFQKLNDYFVPSNRISKNGNPNFTVYTESDWLDVFRAQFNQSINGGQNTDGVNRCKNVPYKVNLYVFYGDVGRLNGQVINEIFGAYVKIDYRDWVFICSTGVDCSNRAQDFVVEFETNFINDFKKNLTWVERCRMDKYPSQICIEEALWTWPRDFNDPQFFYLYTVHLGLLFGIFSILVFHFMIFGLTCPC